MPTPLSLTESFQFVPAVSYATVDLKRTLKTDERPTAFTRAPGEGAFAAGGKHIHDDIVVVEVMTETLQRGFWAAYRGDERRLQCKESRPSSRGGAGLRDYEAEKLRVEVNTARLRALRLAKDAADALVPTELPAVKKKTAGRNKAAANRDKHTTPILNRRKSPMSQCPSLTVARSSGKNERKDHIHWAERHPFAA